MRGQGQRRKGMELGAELAGDVSVGVVAARLGGVAHRLLGGFVGCRLSLLSLELGWDGN